MQLILSALLVATGLLAAGIGISAAQQIVRTTQRTHHRLSVLSTTLVEGWDAWFVGGFTGLTAGFSWVYAFGALALWSLIGLTLIGVGIRLIIRL